MFGVGLFWWLQTSFSSAQGANSALLNPLAGIEGYFEAGKEMGKEEEGEDRERRGRRV